MKKTLLGALVSVLLGVSAQADTYSDLNVDMAFFGPSSLGLKQSYTNSFDILASGYNPARDEITFATATFFFGDVEDVFRASSCSFLKGTTESFTLDLSGDIFKVGSIPVLFALSDSSLGTQALLTLSETGKVSYTVTRTSGSFQLGGAVLCAHAEPRNVPDGGATVALLGVGLVAVFFAKRRFGTA